jgi:heme exporter protein D
MQAIRDFFVMGGYAQFVWPAFAVTAVFMIGVVVVSRRGLRADQRTLEALRAAGGGRRRPFKAGAPKDTQGDGDEA